MAVLGIFQKLKRRSTVGPIAKAVTETINESENSDFSDFNDSTWRCRLPDDIGDAHYGNTFVRRVNGEWLLRNTESF